MKFYTSVAKGFKLKFKRFWGLTPNFVEVTPPTLNKANKIKQKSEIKKKRNKTKVNQFQKQIKKAYLRRIHKWKKFQGSTFLVSTAKMTFIKKKFA